MIKLIIFDLDGVLVDAKEIHYEALNLALSEIDVKYVITLDEHLSIYDGLKTNEKLKILTKLKSLPEDKYEIIWNRKQELTLNCLSTLNIDHRLIKIFTELKSMGYLISCCSNSIKDSITMMLNRIGIIEYMDLILSNEDVINSKPYPDIYWKAMEILNMLPENTLIIEDSPNGLLSANRSNANILRVDSPSDLTLCKIITRINNCKSKTLIPKWKDDKLNILIPMAGAGSRFLDVGYVSPKPLINVNGKPMIQLVVENLNIEANYIYIVREEHRIKYNLDVLLNLITPNCKIIGVDKLTDGAACTTLLADKYINNDNPLLIANSDQFIEWNSNKFMYEMNENKSDGGILTFNSTHPKWSFVKLNNLNNVIEVAEKKTISNLATVGIYYWRKGCDYVNYANSMIDKNIRVNNEFYVCPVYNEAILDNKKIKTFNVDKMWGIGTPDDLKFFLDNHE